MTYDHLQDLRANNEFDPRDLTSGDNRVWKAKEEDKRLSDPALAVSLPY